MTHKPILQNYLENDNYRDIMILKHYALDFGSLIIGLGIVYSSIQNFTIITIVKLLSLTR